MPLVPSRRWTPVEAPPVRDVSQTLPDAILRRPMVAWLIADLSATGSPPMRRIRTVDDVELFLSECAPRIRLRFEDVQSSDGSIIDQEITFRSLRDFDPESMTSRMFPSASLRRQPGECGRARAGSIDDAIQAALRGTVSGDTSDEDGQRRRLGLVAGDPGFALLASRWRLVASLAQAIGEGPLPVHLHVLSIGSGALRRGLREVGRSDVTWTEEILDQPSECRPEVLVVDEEFGVGPDDISCLRGLASIAAELGAAALTDLMLDFDADADLGSPRAAVAVDRALRAPGFAAFRTLRQDPRCAFLALVGHAIPHDRLGKTGHLGQDGQSRRDEQRRFGAGALLGGVIGGLSGSGAVPALGRPMVIPFGAGGAAAGPVGLAAAEELADWGIIAPHAGSDSEHTFGPRLPTLYEMPKDGRAPHPPDPGALGDVRARLLQCRLASLAEAAAHAIRPPGRDAADLRAWERAIASALLPAAARLLGGSGAHTLDMNASARFEGPDERSLRVDLRLACPAAGPNSRYGVLHVATYPFAQRALAAE